MLNVAAPIWNQIAQLGTESQFGARFLTMDQEEMTRAVQALADELESKGIHPEVVSAYLELAPLLAEREAISRYSRLNPQARTFLPEVTSVNEALLIAIRERYLNTSQVAQLRKLLEELR
mgnify:CR=1 FL=1